MVDVSFTIADVQAAAGCRPWDREREFAAEISVEDMADTAAAYARARDEGVHASDLARRAGELTADAGALDGDPLADTDQRAGETHRDLQGGGRNVGRVVDLLVAAMGEATTAEGDVRTEIHGVDGESWARTGGGRTGKQAPRGLDQKVADHVAAARAELASLQDALGEAVYRTRFWEYETPPDISVVDGPNHVVVKPVSGPDGVPVYALPDDAIRAIRRRHLDAAAEDARAAYDAITDRIATYRHRLADLGRELGDLHYDVHDDPLGLWSGEEMQTAAAEHDADLLRAALRDDDADPARIRSLLAGVKSAIDDVNDPTGTLSADQRAYLEAFYGHLTPGDLAALGSLLSPAPEDASEPERDATAWARHYAANGIIALLDPARGGIDPDAEPHRVPESIRHYVYDYEDHLADRDPETVREFDAFGGLMDTPVIDAGEAFGEALGRAAVGHEELTRGARPDDHPLPSGSPSLLSAAASAGDAPARLLADPDFTARLLAAEYYEPEPGDGRETEMRESDAAMSHFLSAATSVPVVDLPGDSGNQARADAAYTYLSYLREHTLNARYADAYLVDSLVEDYLKIDPERFREFESLRTGF
jgi:hypothetical protein